MNKEIKQKWIEALRSGKYKQGINHLRSNDKFCCLGVLCDIALKEGIGKWENDINIDHNVFVSNNGGERATGVLPSFITEWCELEEANPTVTVNDDHYGECSTSIADLNDSGKSFEDIAQIIEENF